MKKEYIVLFDADTLDESKIYAEQINDFHFIIDNSNDVPLLLLIKRRIMLELGLNELISEDFDSINVLPLNDFIYNFNNQKINEEGLFISLIKIN